MINSRNILLRSFRMLVLAALSLSAWGDEGVDTSWSGNLRTKDGIFAFHADTVNRRVLVFRADNRALSHAHLRIRIPSEAGAPLEVILQQADSIGPPWKFGADIKDWDGRGDSAELESSDDGKRWSKIGVFRR